MADKAVVRIPVDLSEWDAFIDSWNHYNAQLEKNGDAWAGTNKGIRTQKTAFDDMEQSFSDLVHKATDQKFSGSNGSFVKITKSSRETEKSWHNIARDLEKSSKSMLGLARGGLNFSSLGGFGILGAVAGAAGGIFAGVKGADDSLANQNILNRKLGLKPGEEKAFSTVFEKAGGDDGLLARVSAAQLDQSKWQAFQALGFSTDQIQHDDPEVLAEQVLQRGGRKFNEIGPGGIGLWAGQTHVDQLLNPNQLQQAGSYSDSDYAGMHQQYGQLQPQLAARQKDLDAAAAAKQLLDAALAKDMLALDLALIKLNPMVVTAADDVAKWVTAFSKSEDFGKDVQDVENAFDELAKAGDWLADKFNNWFGNNDKDPTKTSTVTVDKDGLMANLISAAKHPIDYFSGKDRSAPGFEWNYADWAHNAITGGPKSTEDQYLDATKAVESHGNANAVGPVTAEGWQAKGPYQMSPANLQKYGVVDPFNEAEERRGAARMRADLLKKYHGNEHEVEAAYNWGEGHVDKFLAAHNGQWDENALPPGVLDYIKKMDAHIASGAQTPPPAQSIAQKPKNGTADQPQILPMDSVDQKAIAAQEKANKDSLTESMTDRVIRGLGMIGDAISNGGGAFARGDDRTQQRIARQGNTATTPYQIQVQVTAPPGMNSVVTAQSIAQ